MVGVRVLGGQRGKLGSVRDEAIAAFHEGRDHTHRRDYPRFPATLQRWLAKILRDAAKSSKSDEL